MEEHNLTHKKTTGIFGISNIVLALCIALPVIAILALTVFKVSPGSLLYIGLFLACPLLHVLMMKGGGHKH